MQHFHASIQLPAAAETVFAWHEQPGAIEALMPPWEDVRLVSQSGPISQEGSQVVLSMPLIPGLPWPRLRWVAEHRNYIAERQFQDVQINGPFTHWAHTHRVTPHQQGCLMEDLIEYQLPLGWLGQTFGGWFVRNKLKRLIDYRHANMRQLFAAQP